MDGTSVVMGPEYAGTWDSKPLSVSCPPMKRFFRAFRQDRILGGAAVLAITQFGASLAGLIRDSMLNRTYPGLSTVDVYIASFRLSDLLFQIMIMAGLSTVLIPLLSAHTAHGRHEDASKLLSSVMAMGSIIFGGLALILAFVFPLIAPVLVDFEGEQLALYIIFGRFALLTNFLFVFGNSLGQYLVTTQRYWIYGITPILYTVGTILGTVFLEPEYGELAPMIGTVAGSIVYVLFRAIGATSSGFRFHRLLWHSDLTRMGWLMLPRMVALGALQLELLFFDALASGLDAGAITINANARNFQSAIVGIVGIALAQSAFPLLSTAAARKEMNRFTIYLRKSAAVILLLTIPCALILVAMAPVAARLVHLTPVFRAFQIALLIYAISIPFESLNHLLLRSYYALCHTARPAIFNVLNGISAIAVSWLLLDKYGVYALPIGFTVGQIVQVIGLALTLPRQTTSSSPG